ncbi:5'-methylthioadenosine/S-adenosylhomocysteine nucleosidase [Slackia heliotrinireducens]|uniref:adenosylhomocysteine nucleosidase n=1 Tax=Slackia heliotrinireducens (strain ATCC 29202 / DSM 20476 / NCTC 11029 / RHS 1) TaxID=471855 RepID=C7N759_SLAHD|nr:5'-methylthioadenosine/adenosylhomocysteine nucleosidase [Slackia heliotrinireducens]ACV22744.1 5'-methylthioadenosine/S-adenosylhomocysteine nucleosidase [Slackia heliotrinireducens DSM 20476]VEH01394.1 5'-methylthioadenosine/S-adenosylhomocysteine nucleosidase [Slackia heliotrinireducens]
MAEKTVGIIGAMEVEVTNLIAALENHTAETIAGMEFHCGTLDGTPAVIALCGIGKVNAGMAATLIVDHFGATHVVNTGVAGTLSDQVGIGDFVVSTGAGYHDFDVSPLGFRYGEVPYTKLCVFPNDEAMRAVAVDVISAGGYKVHEGIVASGDQFIGSAGQKQDILKHLDGMCCEMEGAAISHVCYLMGVPCLVVRAISDGANEQSIDDFPAWCAKMGAASADMVRQMLPRF